MHRESRVEAGVSVECVWPVVRAPGSAARNRGQDGDLVVRADAVAVERRFAVAPHSTALHERRELGAPTSAGVGDDLTNRVAIDIGTASTCRDTNGSEQTQPCHGDSLRPGRAG